MSTHEYDLTGMTCAHCEASVRAEVGSVPGVAAIEFGAATGRLFVTAAGTVDDDAVITAVEEAGYHAARA